MKARSERIVMSTAYDATMARLLDRAGIDVLLVGDSLGQVILGSSPTIPVTLDDGSPHARRDAARGPRARRGGHTVSDVSGFGGICRYAARLFQEGGAAAVKLEGGRSVADAVRRLTAASRLPVMGHVGLTPQHVHRQRNAATGTRGRSGAQELIRDAARGSKTPERLPSSLGGGPGCRCGGRD